MDALYKIVHWPTATADIKLLNDTPSKLRNPPLIRALESAMHFMAVRTLTDNETLQHGLGDKAVLTQQLHDATERLIAEADLIRRPTIPALQAYVIYLGGYPFPR